MQVNRGEALEWSHSFSPEHARVALGIPDVSSKRFVEALPFSANDVTAGTETELQAAVVGERSRVDLPITIETSDYFANIIRRASSGDTPRQAVTDLERHLDGHRVRTWENSWVRFPLGKLSSAARRMLQSDLLADRRDPFSGPRSDVDRFFCTQEGEKCLRIPISYLIKISLADVIGSQPRLPRVIRAVALRVMDRLLCDNTSPETLSLHVVPLRSESGFGRGIAKETSKRFLLAQLLIMYANSAFGLTEGGQRATVYFSPHPPIRQKQLNESITDAFYRELFMNPCLSGWDNGQEKHGYMRLCHEVLSRSQLNAVAKLREAGIITRNLVVLPNISNTSLANNGTHLSLGSLKLSGRIRDPRVPFTRADEKHLGDLVIKIVEHFLPLFVGTYCAAPYRLSFSDFHPEKVLGFLPHELDYTHLRMIWRRWKKKASVKIFGQPLTPFGLRSLDRLCTILFQLKGDYIPDFRLIDYLVAPMSTNRSPALNGQVDNHEKLKRDLADLGIFDTKMPLYMLYRQREWSKAGFSGFEGRHYSLFASLLEDMAEAANVQTLITALAFKYALGGLVTHADIPDDPYVESERRQIFFGSAIGIPTFFVHGSTGNRFLKKILGRASGLRNSRRYPGYIRVYHKEFRLALIDVIRTDGADIIENLGLSETMEDLLNRIVDPGACSAEGRLTTGILNSMGLNSPFQASADEFNCAAEDYYRDHLKRSHLREALQLLDTDIKDLEQSRAISSDSCREALRYSLNGVSAQGLLASLSERVLREEAGTDTLRKLIDLLLVTIHYDSIEAERAIEVSASNVSS